MTQPRPARVLMVCTGNICRSTMADAGYAVPDHRARQIRAGELGEWDLILAMTSRHLSVLQRLADRAGVEYGGAPSAGGGPAGGAGSLSGRAPVSDEGAQPRICLYRDLDPAGRGDVPDPWYGGHQDFLDTLEVIERVTPVILDLARFPPMSHVIPKR